MTDTKYVSIRNAVENPKVVWSTFPPVVSAATNLVQLSVVNHRGGYHYWNHILTKEIVPSLRRLCFYKITHFEPRCARPVVDPDCPFLMVTTSSGYPLSYMHPAEELPAMPWLINECTLFDQLELLVSEDNDRLEEFPSLVHLTLLDSTTEILPSSKNAQVLLGDDPSEIDAIFESLSSLLDSDESQLEYLCFPSPFTPTSSQSESSSVSSSIRSKSFMTEILKIYSFLLLSLPILRRRRRRKSSRLRSRWIRGWNREEKEKTGREHTLV